VLSRYIVILELVSLIFRLIQDTLDPRRDEDLPNATTPVDANFGTVSERLVQLSLDLIQIHTEPLENVHNRSLGLLKQSKQYVLSINLCMPIARHDLNGALSRILSTLGEAIQSHHLLTLSLGSATPCAAQHQIVIRTTDHSTAYCPHLQSSQASGYGNDSQRFIREEGAER